ncbi:type II secretion system protein GspM [Endozoicomonas arenosclerae]|uniref:type II secretion system protein GspM n=1 Tax=Endozoicomonas arenosclerae TaxID=1633495 RepID=UPI0007842E6D|nr:type II secretion system protein M [Endozoicomonas arenosclerae]
MNGILELFNERWQQAQSYWNGLSRREQQLCMVGGAAIIVWVIWQGILNPLAERQQAAEQRLAASQKLLLSIQEQANEIVSLRQGQPGKTRYLVLPLDEMVNRTARDYNLRITGVRSVRDTLQVDLDTVGFDRLLEWLVNLEQQGGVEIRELEVEAADKPGQVNVNALRIQKSA